MKVLDSDFLVAILRKDPQTLSKIRELAAEPLAITVFNAHELLFGAEKSTNAENKQATEKLVRNIAQLPYDQNAMQKAIKIIHELEQKGSRIGIFDELIASTCIANDASLVTRNAKHFGKIPHLCIEPW